MTCSISNWSRIIACVLLRLLPALRMCTPRPLVAVNMNGIQKLGVVVRTTDRILTTDVGRAAKRCSNLRIQIDHEVSLFCKLVVSIFHLLRDPLSEFVTT